MESTPVVDRIPLGPHANHEDQARAIASLSQSLVDGRSVVFGPLELVRHHDASTAALMLSGGRIEGLFVLHAAGRTVHRDTLMGAVCHALKCAGAGDLVYVFPPLRPQAPSLGSAGAGAIQVPTFGYFPPPPAPTFGVPPSMPNVVGFGGVVVNATGFPSISWQTTSGLPPGRVVPHFAGHVYTFTPDKGPDGRAVASLTLEEGGATGHAAPNVSWVVEALRRAQPFLTASNLARGVYAAVLRVPGNSFARFPTLASLYGPYDSHPDARCVIRRCPDGDAFTADVTLCVAALAGPPMCYRDYFGPCVWVAVDDGRVIRDIPIVEVQLPQGTAAASLTEDAWALMAIAQLARDIDSVRRPGRPFVVVIAERWYTDRTFGELRLMGAFETAQVARTHNTAFGGLRHGCPRYIVDAANAASRV